MKAREVLLIGSEELRKKCKEVKEFGEESLLEEIASLQDTLEKFRSENGFGRAISAPQIGVNKRIIALHLKVKNFF